jgi:hypothetical protein
MLKHALMMCAALGHLERDSRVDKCRSGSPVHEARTSVPSSTYCSVQALNEPKATKRRNCRVPSDSNLATQRPNFDQRRRGSLLLDRGLQRSPPARRSSCPLVKELQSWANVHRLREMGYSWLLCTPGPHRRHRCHREATHQPGRTRLSVRTLAKTLGARRSLTRATRTPNNSPHTRGCVLALARTLGTIGSRY